ncbi:MAG: TIGR03013 family PEP-CTERM/XrtA system glycosyltransferase [Xanthomonadales bacterium]|nr:TIGR03013 family PEP-CTERM/XrtA system glycosyltransferase [Xanthomonadales bacterium]
MTGTEPVKLDGAPQYRLLPRFLRHTASRWRSVVLAVEFSLLVLAVVLAVYLRFFTYDAPLQAYTSLWLQLARAAAFALFIMFGLTAMGLYQAHLRETWFGAVARQALAFLLGATGLLVLYYVLPELALGRGVLGLALLIGFALLGLFRVASARLFDLEPLKRRVLVLGAGERAALIEQRLRRRADRRGFHVVGYVPQAHDKTCVPAEKLRHPDLPLAAWAQRERIDEIVVGPDERRGALPMDELLGCRQAGINLIDLVGFFERESGKIKLGLTDPSWLVFSGGFDSSLLRRISKRAFDLVAAGLLLVLTAPALLVVALAIRLESGRGQPILYRQQRVGLNNREFTLVKFRSMRTDAELDGVAKWASKDDDRVTRTGRFIRRARLDELPQLWNILRGDMSVVGPRPERPQFVEHLAGKLRYYNLRHCVRPGLAGWAQLRYPYGASDDDALEKLKYDLFYVKNNNLLFDVLILIQTVEVVLFGRGVR